MVHEGDGSTGQFCWYKHKFLSPVSVSLVPWFWATPRNLHFLRSHWVMLIQEDSEPVSEKHFFHPWGCAQSHPLGLPSRG